MLRRCLFQGMLTLLLLCGSWCGATSPNAPPCDADAGGGGPVLSGSYRLAGRCSSGHVGEALRLGEGCEARPTILRLPWPHNSSHIDQVEGYNY